MHFLPPQLQSYFDKTTEKTIEVNCMSELTKLFSPSYVVTVLGPSRVQEKELGFDDILSGLPPGQTFALQFKKPFLRGDGYPRFTLNVSQLQVLLSRFSPREAFFVLSPFTSTLDFIAAHQSGVLLHQCALVDVYDIPFPTKQEQGTRTIKYVNQGQIEVTDPRRYYPVKRTWSFDRLAESVMEGNVGRKGTVEEIEFKKAEKKRYGGPNYYVHVAHKREETREQ